MHARKNRNVISRKRVPASENRDIARDHAHARFPARKLITNERASRASSRCAVARTYRCPLLISCATFRFVGQIARGLHSVPDYLGAISSADPLRTRERAHFVMLALCVA